MMVHLSLFESYALLKLASPIIINAVISQFISMITLYFVGRLDGSEFIGAATLGNMMCNITGYSLTIGKYYEYQSILIIYSNITS